MQRLDLTVTASPIGHAFAMLDRLLRLAEPLFPADPRRRAIDKAVALSPSASTARTGWAAFSRQWRTPLMMFDCLGYSPDHPELRVRRGRRCASCWSLTATAAYCQPCVSPVWDTALACHALMEVGERGWTRRSAVRSTGSRASRCSTWSATGPSARPGLRPGGWAFQYANPHYPDLDDTAAVALALDRFDRPATRAIDRAAEWVIGMQSRNGGWGSFDADNTHYYLNHIPFADHGALLDPPTADVSARCLGFLAQIGYGRRSPGGAAGIDYLLREQEADGSWFGRWGTNYIYGTWSVLAALNARRYRPERPTMRRAVAWLVARSAPTAAGAKAATATSPARRAARRRTAPHRRRPGRCWR